VTNDQALEAARLLAAARTSGTAGPRLPEDVRPGNLEDAFLIQGKVSELLGGNSIGYKCSAPTAERAANVSPVLRRGLINRSPVTVQTERTRIEPEVAYVLGSDLPPRAQPHTLREVCDAISQVRLVLELIAVRFLPDSGAGFLESLAGHLSNEGLFLGPQVAIAPDDPALAGFPIVIESPTGIVMERAGKHPDGHPMTAMLWLANFLSSRGEGLKEGQLVTTGSFAGALELPLNTPLRIMFGGVGDIECELVR